MKNIWTIAKREYDNYFNSPLAYVVALAIFLPIGIYFAVIMFATSQQAAFGGSRAPEATPITWLFIFLMIFLSPAITMRLLSDEARMGTLELLLTSPCKQAPGSTNLFLNHSISCIIIAGLIPNGSIRKARYRWARAAFRS